MKQVRAIIADDEEALRDYLEQKLAVLWPELIIVGKAKDGATALGMIEELRPDIAFLDIKMPGLSGIEVARKTTGQCMVVFVTAYDRYAVEAFEQEDLDYLLKPITDERLEKTVHRLKERIASASLPDMSIVLDRVSRAIQGTSGHLQWIKAQHKDGIRLIPVSDIYYFKATDKYTTVRTREGESLIRKTISELANELDANQFWRVHRAAIVNAKTIHEVKRSFAGAYTILFEGIQDQLPVSRAYAHLFKQM
jgi:DNA-binding LytR/AlgR family response regulator